MRSRCAEPKPHPWPGPAGTQARGGGTASGRLSGVLIVLGAAAAWGFGSVLGHRLPLPRQAMLAAAIEMLAGGAVLLAVAAGTGEFGRIRWASVPASSWLALPYLVVAGSILACTAYGYALARLPLPTVLTYAYVDRRLAGAGRTGYHDEGHRSPRAKAKAAEPPATGKGGGRLQHHADPQGSGTLKTRVPQFCCPLVVWLDLGGMYSVASQAECDVSLGTANE